MSVKDDKRGWGLYCNLLLNFKSQKFSAVPPLGNFYLAWVNNVNYAEIYQKVKLKWKRFEYFSEAYLKRAFNLHINDSRIRNFLWTGEFLCKC